MIREPVYIPVHFNINHATAQGEEKNRHGANLLSFVISYFLVFCHTIQQIGIFDSLFKKSGMTAYLSKHSFPRKKQQGNTSVHLRGIDFL